MALDQGMASTGIDIPEFEEEHIVPQVTYPKIKGKEHMLPRIPIENVEFSEPSTPDSKRAEPSGFIHPPSETSSNRHICPMKTMLCYNSWKTSIEKSTKCSQYCGLHLIT